MRTNMSRAMDFPWMDAGRLDFQLQENHSFREDEVCRAGGYTNLYEKSIVVTRTSFSTSMHVPGSCSDGVEDGFVEPFRAGRYINIGRDTLISQHFVEMLSPGRYVFAE